jgi:hypothetical protein
MNCDDVWPDLETGNWWKRWRARRHLKQCAACARAAGRLAQFKQILAEREPVSADLQGRWLAASAAGGSRTRVIGRVQSKFAVGAIASAAAAILAAIALLPQVVRQANRPKQEIHEPPPTAEYAAPPAAVVHTSPVEVTPIDVGKELSRFRLELAQSESEIRKLDDQAKLRRASAQLDVLLDKYARN